MVGVVQDELGEGHVLVQERWKAPPERIELDFSPEQRYQVEMPGSHPNLLCLNVKVTPRQFKVLRQCGHFEARQKEPDGSMRPLELRGCRLVKHDKGRGHWTFLVWVSRLPDSGATVQLQMTPKGGDS